MSLEVIRNKKPPRLRKIKFNLPEVIKFKLDNNLQVYFIQKSTLPLLSMSLVTEAGSKYDPAGKKGLTNLLAMAVDEGAGDYDSLQLSDQFEILGASFSISCDQDSVYFSLQVLKDEFERGLELFSTILIDSHLYEADLSREKRKIKTRILQTSDEADEIANEVFEYKLFGNNNPYAYPTIGYSDDIDSISLQDIKDFYNHFIVPENSFLVVTGDYETESLKNILNKYFRTWSRSSITKPRITNADIEQPGLYIIDKKDSVQSEIRTGLISYKRNDYDFYARSILNLILGGQFSSRLNLNLREHKGFTYGVYSRFIYLMSSAYLFVSTSVSSENTGAALTEIFKEIKKIRNGITKKELEFAKSSLIRKFPSSFESYRQIASNVIGQIIHTMPEDYFETYIDEIKKVTRERIIKAAEDNLFPDKLTTVIVGSKEKTAAQLKDIYNGEIIELDEKGSSLQSL